MTDINYKLKLVIVGDRHVGKSAFLLRLIYKQFNLKINPTIGFQYGSLSTKYDNKNIDIDVWDCKNYNEDKNNFNLLLDACVGVIIITDCTKKINKNYITNIISDIKLYNSNIYIDLFINKTDLSYLRKITQKKVKKLQKYFNFNCYEVSCLSGDNLAESFNEYLNNCVTNFLNIINN